MPLRVDLAILLLVLVTGAVAFAVLQARRRRRPPHGIRVDLVGGDGVRPEHPGAPLTRPARKRSFRSG